MPKIKLIKVYDTRSGCDYCDYVKETLVEDMSPWQEVSEKDLQWLESWQGRHMLQKKNTALVILQDITSQETVTGFIHDIKKFVEEEDKREIEREKKRKLAAEKSKLAAEQRKIEKAKKLLAKSGIKVD